MKEGSSYSKYANKRLRNSEGCIIKEEPIKIHPIDLRNDGYEIGTLSITSTAINLRKDVWDVYIGTTMATTAAVVLWIDGYAIDTTTSVAIVLRKDISDVHTCRHHHGNYREGSAVGYSIKRFCRSFSTPLPSKRGRVVWDIGSTVPLPVRVKH